MTPALLTAESAATSTRHVVELRDVVMRFGGKQVLDHVSLAVAPQERLVIIGQNHHPAFNPGYPEAKYGLRVLQ